MVIKTFIPAERIYGVNFVGANIDIDGNITSIVLFKIYVHSSDVISYLAYRI